MIIHRAGSRPSETPPAEYFTGRVRMETVTADADSAVKMAMVTFEPGARTAWHTHPLGQTLLVQSGVGRVQTEGGPIREIRPGDVIWFPPHVRHWHGAAPDVAMCHLAIQEAENGSPVTWMEHVADADYLGLAG